MLDTWGADWIRLVACFRFTSAFDHIVTGTAILYLAEMNSLGSYRCRFAKKYDV